MKRFRTIFLAALLLLPFLVSCDREEPKPDDWVAVSSVSLDPKTIELNVGDKAVLTATVLPENASCKVVGWFCAKTDIVEMTVSGNVVTIEGKAAGEATVSVTTQDGSYVENCKVTVVQPHVPVRPSGEGWTKTAVVDGIDLYTFIGTDKYVRKPQSVYVADVDLAKYELKFAYDGTRHITSDVLKKYSGAVVAMNGAYETSSIYIRIDGKRKFGIENDKISGTDVPNWKNDGMVAVTTDGELCIVNTIFANSETRQTGSGSYGLTLKEQRDFYFSNDMKKYVCAYSSAPLLIDDYDPIGETFVPVKYQSYSESSLGKAFPDSENPIHHQGYTHPRTAVALTCDNHLLMIAADGRFSQADGFSSHALTRFLVEYFDPRYALNMDGGGSTTLCVAGLGDSSTHVVNHPYDNGKYDAAGERDVTTHFYVVKRK